MATDFLTNSFNTWGSVVILFVKGDIDMDVVSEYCAPKAFDESRRLQAAALKTAVREGATLVDGHIYMYTYASGAHGDARRRSHICMRQVHTATLVDGLIYMYPYVYASGAHGDAC